MLKEVSEEEAINPDALKAGPYPGNEEAINPDAPKAGPY
jgi:hypothetical protein